MRDVGLLPDMSRPPVERAVLYVAGRLRHDGDLAYLCGPGTGSYEVLREACEALGYRLELSREPSRFASASSSRTGPDCDDCGRELECFRCDYDDSLEAHEDCDDAIAELRKSLAALLAAVDASAAREVGSDLWCAVHEARMALQRTQPT